LNKKTVFVPSLCSMHILPNGIFLNWVFAQQVTSNDILPLLVYTLETN